MSIREQHFTDLKNSQARKLSELTDTITKGESPRWQGYEYSDEGVLFVTSENVLSGTYSAEPKKLIPEEFHRKLSRSELRNGDVLVNLVGASIGRACIYDSDDAANVNQAVAVIRCNRSELLPTYLLSYLLSPSILRKLLGGSVNTARANISLTQLRDMAVPETSLREQVRFCSRIEALTRNLQKAEAHISRLSLVMKSIVAAYFDHV